ncbi:MAG: hypothetical protein PF961_15215 [Planctomycetota bacterium]|jgi:GGDEF domain-containing protein|nr:hypothetical protein [Planctomycetota bacterium]
MLTKRAHVLLIGQDEMETAEFKAAVPERMVFEAPVFDGLLVETRVDEVVFSQRWEVPFEGFRYDMCICSVRAGGAPLLMARSGLIREISRGLVLVSDGRSVIPADLRQNEGNSRVLARPFTIYTLGAAVEECLCTALAIQPDELAEDHLVNLMRRLTILRAKRISPVLDPQGTNVVRYPVIRDALGPLVAERELLEHLTSLGLVSRRLDQRGRCCPRCGSLHLIFHEACTQCGGIDYDRQTIIHHFTCGHADALNSFRSEGQLICPKCERELKRVGQDYDRLPEQMRCNSCREVFEEPTVASKCMGCHWSGMPTDTEEQLIYGYELLPQADQVVMAGHLSATKLGELFRDLQGGLVTQQLFEFELERELTRFRRYDIVTTLLMVRILNLREVRERAPQRATEYAFDVHTALADLLRNLDLACVLAPDTMAILLPATDGPGSEVVANRVREAAATMIEADDLGSPELAITAVMSDSALVDADAWLDAGLRQLRAMVS